MPIGHIAGSFNKLIAFTINIIRELSSLLTLWRANVYRSIFILSK